MRRAILISSLFLGVCALPSTVRADAEAWTWVEGRVPVLRAEKPGFPRIDWRVFTDVRMNRRSGGLAQLFFRTGPLFFVTDWMFVGTHATIYADRLKSGEFDQEVRAELEPNLFGRLGDFVFNDRNRLEFRWRESGERFRYRNQLRVSYAPKGAVWIPFVWDELLIDLSGDGVNQNRFQVGTGRMLNDTMRVDFGFMVRSRKENEGWMHDGIANLVLFFDVPKQR